MIMDVSRFCYKRSCRFFRSGPEQTIVWYRAPSGAKVFPSWHLFGSINYSDEPWLTSGALGEQFGESPKWWQGETPDSARGLRFYGPLEFFQQGQPVPLAAPIVRDPWGLAAGCTSAVVLEAVSGDVDSGTVATSDETAIAGNLDSSAEGPLLDLWAWFRPEDVEIGLPDQLFATWPDASGNGRDLVQPLIPQRPFFQHGSPFGQALYSGTQNSPTTTGESLGSDCSVYIAGQLDATTGSKHYGPGFFNQGVTDVGCPGWGSNAVWYEDDTTRISVSAPLAAASKLVIAFRRSGGNVTLTVAGVAEATVAIDPGGTVTPGELRAQASTPDVPARRRCEVREVCIYNRFLSQTEHEFMLRYFAGKYP